MITSLIDRVSAAAPDSSEFTDLLPINQDITDIGGLVTLVITWIIYIGGVLAFIYLVVSGITYITAGGNAEQAKKGQAGIINAVIGIVVIVLAFVILKAVSGIAGGTGAE